MEPSERSGRQQRRVLIVDDEPDFVALMAEFLAELPEPPSITVAHNGQAAVDAVRHDPPDLVLLDVNMPVMNGLEAFRHIRALDPMLPVVLVTGTDHRSASQGLTAGVFAYLPKPVDLRYVSCLVDLALRSRARHDARSGPA
jgi:CheY-like chemotaxis protein